MPDTDLVVEVPGLPLPEAEKKEATVETAAKPVKADDAAADLKRQFEELSASSTADKARLAETQAEVRRHADEADRARTELASTRSQLSDSNVATLDNAIAAATSEADRYQQDYQTALEAGDFKAAAVANRKIAESTARVAQLETGKADLEFHKKAEADKPKEVKQERSVSDPFESTLATFTPRTAKWMRDQKAAGRDYVTNPSMNAKAASAHYAAVAEGLSPDTDAYFEFCERQLGLREAAKSNGAANGGEQKQRTAAMPSAPVSHESTASGGQLSPTQVRLTAGEVEAATKTLTWNYSDEKLGAVKGQPIGVKEYAKRKLAMQAEGRYGVLQDS